MKAQVFYRPSEMQLEERPIPEIADDEVLVRVRACGICGSDVAYYGGQSPLETSSGEGPLVLGHEISGEVVRIGALSAQLGLLQIADRVVLNPVQYCNACEACTRGMVNLCEKKTVIGVSVDGGFAEYCKAKYPVVYKLPAKLTLEQAALVEPLACATYAIQNLDVESGHSCVVIGPGPIGLMMIQLIKAAGAGRVILVGTRDYRLQVGRELGADAVVNVREPESPDYAPDLKARIGELTNGKLADRAVTPTASLEGMAAALEITGRRARIVYFGLPGPDDYVRVPALATMFYDKTIRFSWLAPFTWPAAIQSLATGSVEVRPLITHRLTLDHLAAGLHRIRQRDDRVLKAMVTFAD